MPGNNSMKRTILKLYLNTMQMKNYFKTFLERMKRVVLILIST
jgi:hypothetical protein